VTPRTILLGNAVGCGGKFIREVLSFPSNIHSKLNLIDFSCLVPDNIYHYYNIEAIHCNEIKDTTIPILLVYPVRDFFDHFYFLKAKYRGNIDAQIFTQMVLASKKGIDSLQGQPNLIFKPITIFKQKDRVLYELHTILKRYMCVDVSLDQIKNFAASYVFDSAFDRQFIGNYKIELMRSRGYAEAFDWYNDLYLESVMGM
jgi:hypothetical protein